MEDSIFTKIIRGDIPVGGRKLYEDDKTFVMLDINPLSDGHTLVISKRQVDKVYELPEDDYTALFATVKKVAAHLEEVLGARIGIVVEGLAVPHAHVHLVPLYDSEVLKLHHGYPVKKGDEDLARLAAKLRMK
jgi:histidine triad (HIT) family protein